MKLLELQPEVAPGAPPEPPEDAPRDEPQADPGARTCSSCGATMDPAQDWCLACGTASAPLGERPGWRSAMTVLGLTFLLVAGAVAASYAALRSDPAAPPVSSNAHTWSGSSRSPGVPRSARSTGEAAVLVSRSLRRSRSRREVSTSVSRRNMRLTINASANQFCKSTSAHRRRPYSDEQHRWGPVLIRGRDSRVRRPAWGVAVPARRRPCAPFASGRRARDRVRLPVSSS